MEDMLNYQRLQFPLPFNLSTKKSSQQTSVQESTRKATLSKWFYLPYGKGSIPKGKKFSPFRVDPLLNMDLVCRKLNRNSNALVYVAQRLIG